MNNWNRLKCLIGFHEGVCEKGCFVCRKCGKVLDVYTKHPYTKSEIRTMTSAEYRKCEKIILAQMAKGLIK